MAMVRSSKTRRISRWISPWLLGGVLTLGILAQPCAMAMTAGHASCQQCPEAGLVQHQPCADHQPCLRADAISPAGWALAFADGDEPPAQAAGGCCHPSMLAATSSAAHSWHRTDTVPRASPVSLSIRYCVFLK